MGICPQLAHSSLHFTGQSVAGSNLGLIFIYVFLVWLLLSILLAVYMCLYGKIWCRQKFNRNTNCRMSAISIDSRAIPSEWRNQTERLEKVEVAQFSDEWRTVESQFKTTLSSATITNILRIQNRMLWKSYIQEKSRLLKKNKGEVNEKQLFHGTRKNDPELIYNGEEGFEMRLAGDGMWGQANYFAVNASYSDDYAFVQDGLRAIFLVSVLTGKSFKMEPDRSLRIPPEIPGPTVKGDSVRSTLPYAKRRYDSVNGFTNGSEVYMTYDNRKSYPTYLINYQK